MTGPAEIHIDVRMNIDPDAFKVMEVDGRVEGRTEMDWFLAAVDKALEKAWGERP